MSKDLQPLIILRGNKSWGRMPAMGRFCREVDRDGVGTKKLKRHLIRPTIISIRVVLGTDSLKKFAGLSGSTPKQVAPHPAQTVATCQCIPLRGGFCFYSRFDSCDAPLATVIGVVTRDRTRPMLQKRQKVLARAPSTRDPRRKWSGAKNSITEPVLRNQLSL